MYRLFKNSGIQYFGNSKVSFNSKLDIDENCISIFTVGDQLLWGAAEPIRRMLKILVKKGNS